MMPGTHPTQRSTGLQQQALEGALALGQAVASELHLEPLCDVALQHLAAVFKPQALTLLFLDESTGRLYVKRRWRAGATSPALPEGPDDVAARAAHEQRLVCEQGLVALPLQTHSGEPAAAVPLIAQRRVKGVLELTWGAGQGAPEAADLRLLETLATQVSAALDNAWLYGELRRLNAELEAKVEARTQELQERNTQLQQTLQDLKQAQSQLVQSEKMASLGQLTAGVAHEINNPLAYSINNLAIGVSRLTAVSWHLRLTRAKERLNAASSAAERLEAVAALGEQWRAHPRHTQDVAALAADVQGLSPQDAVQLALRFVEYLEKSAQEEGDPQGQVERLGDLLGRTQAGLERVKGIVLNLRTFSRLDEAQFQNAVLDEVVAGAVAIVEHQAVDRVIQLKHIKGLDQPYPCFPAKLSQVVLNLLTNALQATPTGGSVTVRCSLTALGPLIEVQDTGCGIAPEHLARVFDPFFTTKPVGQGTGLGLSISHTIIQEHGGTIGVDSRHAEGTTFRIQLPPPKGPRSTP